ncbi:hypothetical protein LWQ05_003874 [Salmonella enterica]|nr:hypothetical protein [Salmonella enterica]
MTSNNAAYGSHVSIKEPPLPEILTDAQASHWLLRARYFFKENDYFASLLIPVGLLIAARYVFLNWLTLPGGAALCVLLAAVGITLFVVFLGLLFWHHESLLAPLRTSELPKIMQCAVDDPAVMVWLQAALRDGKTLRLRDYKAADTHRTWHRHNEERLAKLAALHNLVAAVEPESPALTPSGAYPVRDERIDGSRTEA